ncbi:hypothetical protein IW138_002948 [Coemansia sp. RSA 986]|nr:hypothetical protein IW138_002948 [Coemansia sp. RSA 986]
MKCLLHTFPLDINEHDSVGLFFWATIACSWVLSFAGLLTSGKRNYSIVDRLWPVFPLLLVVHWAALTPWDMVGPKAHIVQSLVLAWSLRLTYNSIRRGDYACGAEDYRWAVVRSKFGTIAWELFNLLFISVFQVTLLYMLAKPVRHITAYELEEWSVAELVLVPSMALLLVGEAVADQQQYVFQTGKRQQLVECSAGFVHAGLWKYSRHPNVFCEQAFWICIALFCAQATGVDLGVWNGACEYLGGVTLLVALLRVSVGLTESISRSKYPLYQAYQVKTSRLVPWAPWSNARVISQAHRNRS